MLRQLIKPQLWWWLALPVLFWQTWGVCISTPTTRIPYGIFGEGGASLVHPWGDLSLYQRMLPYFINHYLVFGLSLSPHAYSLVEDTMQALVVVVVAIYVKEHFWPRILPGQP